MTDTGYKAHWFRALVMIFFFLSGAAGLIYEVVWMRQLTLLFGSTVFAVSAVLTAFMGGLALGSVLFGRWAGRLSNPLLTYGFLEVGVGLYALLIPVILEILTPFYRLIAQTFSPSLYFFSLLRFVLATGILLIPTTLMGGTLPLVSQWWAGQGRRVGYTVGRLYALNTFGAVLGVVGAGFFLLPGWGLIKTTYLAVLLNLAIGMILLALLTRFGERRVTAKEAMREVSPPAGRISPQPHSRRTLLLVLGSFGLSGFAAMAYEVAWTRMLVLILGSSTYAFTLMLATFLIGLALGSDLLSRVADRLRSPLAVFGLLEIGIGATALWGMFQFQKLPVLYLHFFQSLSGHPELLIGSKFLLSAIVILLPTVLMGGIFPLVVRLTRENTRTVGLSVGRAYGLNSIGAIMGSFTAGFLMIPFMGIQATIAWLIILNLTLGLLLLFFSHEKILAITGAGTVALLGLLSITHPASWNSLAMSSGVYQAAPVLLELYPSPAEAMRLFEGYEGLFYKEGVNSTVSVFRKPALTQRPHLALAIDGKVDASTSRDMSTQVLSGHLPLMTAEHGEKVLVVGYASGVTVGSALLYPLKEVVVAEIEPAVIEASRQFDAYNHRPLGDPRVRLVLDDGRHYLQMTAERFDVIISEPSNPWMSGPARLFTHEFFEQGRTRLTTGGVFAQWVQLYGMEPEMVMALVRTFHAVFPEVLVFRVSEGDLLILGSEQPLRMDYPRLEQWMAETDIRQDLERVGIRDPLDLATRLWLGTQEIREYLGTGPINTDDNGLIEFQAPKTVYQETVSENIKALEAVSWGAAPYLHAVGDTPLEEAAFYVKLAGRYLDAGKSRYAEALVHQALSKFNLAQAHWLLGRIQANRGNRLTAKQYWKEALRLDPSHTESLLSLAQEAQEEGDFREARDYLVSARMADPENPWPRYYNGLNHFYLGALPTASSELSRFLSAASDQEGPDTILSRYYLSLAYERQGQQEIADQERLRLIQQLRDLRTRLEQDEGRESLDRLLEIMSEHGRQRPFHEAEQGLRLLIARHLTNPLAHYYRGVSLYFLGDEENAVRELETVLKRLPEGDDSPRTRHYLEQISAGRKPVKEQRLFASGPPACC